MKKYLSYSLIVLSIVGLLLWGGKDEPLSFGAIGTPTSLTTGNDTDGGSGATTSSVSPTGNNLLLLTVVSRTAISTDPNEPTATGNGLTWVVEKSVVYDATSSTRRRVTVFRTMGASPSSGAITIDFGGQAQTDVLWSLDQVSGVDTSGTNGSGAVVQSVSNFDNSATTNTVTVTLAAFSSANNITYGAFGFDGGAPTTAGTSFTATASLDSAANALQALTEYQMANDTTVNASSNANGNLGGIGIEIKAAPVVTTAGPAVIVTGRTIIQGKTIIR